MEYVSLNRVLERSILLPAAMVLARKVRCCTEKLCDTTDNELHPGFITKSFKNPGKPPSLPSQPTLQQSKNCTCLLCPLPYDKQCFRAGNPRTNMDLFPLLAWKEQGRLKNNQLNNKIANIDEHNEAEGQASRSKGHLLPHLLKWPNQRCLNEKQ